MASKCGTYGGYQSHIKKGEEPCGECRVAARQYAKDYRAKNPRTVRASTEHAKIRNRALARLATRHLLEFRQLFAEEKARYRIEKQGKAS